MNAALLTAEHDQGNPIILTYNYYTQIMLESDICSSQIY